MHIVSGLRVATAALVATMTYGATPGVKAASFSDGEKRAVAEYWTHKARYSTEPAGSPGEEWCVRLTPEGSKWIREVYRQLQASKVVPTQDPEGNTPQQKAWTSWIDRQVARDWAEAERSAAELNSGKAQHSAPREKWDPASAPLERRTGTDKIERAPQPAPVPQGDTCPADLVALVGQPPRFSAAVRPMKHLVTFQDGTTVTYTDNVKVRNKYAYYRFCEGVNSGGTSVKDMPSATLEDIIKSAGITGSEERVMRAVSMLEGGFDSVNTYDTGYVSIGFIQFACLGDGGGSLGEMMAHYKASNPKEFSSDFRKYGIDVEDSKLVAYDWENDIERRGPEAALQIIHDKRLTAVFQLAGLKSKAFKIAQLQAAKKQFYPGSDTLTVNLGGSDYAVKLSEVFRTEAGMATLMDRKVNTGKLLGLKETIERVANMYGLQQPGDLPEIEYTLTRAMTYRQDYLLSASLSKPRDNTVQLSRRGARTGRTGDPASAGGGSRK